MQEQVYSIDEIRQIVTPIAKLHSLFALGGLYADLEDALKKALTL